MSLALFLLKERLKMGKIISLIQTLMYLILDNAGSPYKLKFADLMSWLATQTTLSERPMVNFHNNTAFFPSWVQCCTQRLWCTTVCFVGVAPHFVSVHISAILQFLINIFVCSINVVQNCLFLVHHICCLFYGLSILNTVSKAVYSEAKHCRCSCL